jgi:hypothetical protein
MSLKINNMQNMSKHILCITFLLVLCGCATESNVVLQNPVESTVETQTVSDQRLEDFLNENDFEPDVLDEDTEREPGADISSESTGEVMGESVTDFDKESDLLLGDTHEETDGHEDSADVQESDEEINVLHLKDPYGRN